MQRRLTLLLPLLVVIAALTRIAGAADRPEQFRAHRPALASPAAALGEPLRILALRVEFVADQLATTTGSGRFDYGTESSYALDRPPHDRTYFEHQLRALNAYFARVSSQRVQIIADVFPAGEQEAYQLTHDMLWYSGQESETLQKQRWAELLRDAVQAAIAGGGINFSNYDYLIVFHAGVGQDFAFDFDTTPFDIQSVYLDAPSVAEGLGQDPATFKGIACPDGHYFRDGIILPETQNQESLNLGLLGTMTLLFGSQIGMPSLFDTNSGRAGIGMWGLMDQGSFNFQGFIPAEPSAWEKIYMGWEEPVIVQRGEAVAVGAPHTTSAPRIIKIPISASEYFLVENRQRDPNRDRMAIGRDEAGLKAEFDSTGRVVAAAGIGVLTRVDDYDFGLPGSGLLIWHIDEAVIAASLAANTVNADRLHRGVDLVECDGAQDIGYVYDMFSGGYGTENGDYWDPWWAGNESHKVVNTASAVSFSEASIPNSNGYGDANGNAPTRIRLDSFSSLDTVMTLNIASGLVAPGFPRLEARDKKLLPASLTFLAATSEGGSLAADRESDGALVAAAADGALYGWRENGEPLFAGGSHLLASPGVAPAAAPLLLDLDQNGETELFYPAGNGQFFIYSLSAPPPAPGQLALLARLDLAASPTLALLVLPPPAAALLVGDIHGRLSRLGRDPVSQTWQITDTISLGAAAITGLAAAPDGRIVAATAAGAVIGLTAQPGLAILWQNLAADAAGQPLLADLSRDGLLDLAIVSGSGRLTTLDMEGRLTGRYQPPVALSGIKAPALGDIDGDGTLEILCLAREAAIALEFNGALALHHPLPAGTDSVGLLPASPVFARNDDSGMAWIAFATADGLVHAIDANGHPAAGFPLSANAASHSALLLADIDGDNRLELAVAGGDGSINLWDLDLASGGHTIWGQPGGDNRAYSLAAAALPGPDYAALLPSARLFSWPNPVRSGGANIHFTLSRQSEQVTVRIFDLAGNFVQEIIRENLPAGDNEIAWAIDQVQSGLYLARVEAQAGSERSFAVIKIAVTR